MRVCFALIALPVVVLSVACGSDPSNPGSGSGGGGAAPASSAGGGSAAASQGGGPSSSGGARTENGVAGSPSSRAGSGGTSSAGQAGAPTTNASGGTLAAGGAGDGTSTGCTRELLKSTIDAYFTALAAHDPSTLPLSDGAKFTENAKSSKPADAPLWKTAGPVKYTHSALDTETCSSATEAVVPDGSVDIPLALRIKITNQKITEIETIAVRPGDYKVSGQNFASNTAALIASNASVKWEEPVPADKRATRAELTGWMDKYYRQFPAGVCNTSSSCIRIENGGGSFMCSAGASCSSGSGGGQLALTPRLIFADVESGLGVGFTMFQGNTDMHLFKMSGGQVQGVSAILGAAGNSGWD